MIVRWTKDALDEFDSLMAANAAFGADSPRRAALEIEEGLERLTEFPRIGRRSNRPEERELVLRRLPYVIGYRVSEDAVEVLAVRHTARDWPDTF